MPRPLMMATHPDRHPYVDNLRPFPPADHGWEHRDVGAQFWDVDVLEQLGVVLVHLHFGFELVPVADLQRWCEQLQRAGIALVHTVHDLDNPHLRDQREFHVLAGVLAAESDVLITLTTGAADVVERRWGRRPFVVPHPHVVPLDLLEAPSTTSCRRGVHVNLGMVRPNLDLGLVEEAAEAAAGRGGLHGHVVHSRLREVDATTRRRISRLALQADVHLTVGPLLDDHDLWSRLSTARVVLLPYRWGTHSGMLEAARDLGATPVAPAVGCYADQGARIVGPGPVADTIVAALDDPPPERPPRRLERVQIAATHEELYRDALLATFT